MYQLKAGRTLYDSAMDADDMDGNGDTAIALGSLYILYRTAIPPGWVKNGYQTGLPLLFWKMLR